MARHRIPLVIRALVLFLASLPIVRASAAGAHASGPLPAHEAPAPAGAMWARPAPFAVSASGVGVVAVAYAAQRARPHAAVQESAARATSHARTDAGPAAASARARPHVPGAQPFIPRAGATIVAFCLASALTLAASFAHATPSFLRRTLSTSIRPRAPCGACRAAVC
jgi:hypothetical protein